MQLEHLTDVAVHAPVAEVLGDECANLVTYGRLRLWQPAPSLRSTPCTRASRWMAATVSVSSRMRRQSRAAMVPMLTLSWLWHSVLRLNTLAGMVSFSASAASAEP